MLSKFNVVVLVSACGLAGTMCGMDQAGSGEQKAADHVSEAAVTLLSLSQSARQVVIRPGWFLHPKPLVPTEQLRKEACAALKRAEAAALKAAAPAAKKIRRRKTDG